MTPIDQAAQAYREANPPPPWWPFPPASTGKTMGDIFPLVGACRGSSAHDEVPALRRQRADRYMHTDGDILAVTFPGDRIDDVAARIGCRRDYILGRRHRSDTDLAAKMDAKRGRSR